MSEGINDLNQHEGGRSDVLPGGNDRIAGPSHPFPFCKDCFASCYRGAEVLQRLLGPDAQGPVMEVEARCVTLSWWSLAG